MWGHRLVRVPPVGMSETFEIGHHAAGERTYAFPDRSGRPLVLVPDSLPAIAALVARRAEAAPRVSFSCPVFRYRHSHRRHWHHLGALTVVPAPLAGVDDDAFMVERLLSLMLSFVAPRLSVRVILTDLGIWRLRLRADGLTREAVASTLHELSLRSDEERPRWLAGRGVGAETLRFADHAARVPALHDGDAGGLVDSLRGEAAGRASRLLALASRIQARHAVAVEVRLGELHAAEFHDGLAFQILAAADDRRLGDGGSYSDYARRFFPREVALYSTVLGLEEMARRTAGPPTPAAAVMLWSGPERAAHELAAEIADALRAAGIAVHEEPASGHIDKALRQLEALQIPHFIRVGDSEVRTGILRVRAHRGALTELPRERLVEWLREQSGR
jgi:ATP phosphoribosyltransferase regulatory subunit HisZ